MNAVLIIVFATALLTFSSTVFRDIGLTTAMNPDALMIIVGGTIVAVFFAFPLNRLKSASSDIFGTFRTRRSRQEIARDILEIARIYRRADIRGLEKRIRFMEDDILKMGVTLLISRHSNEEIRTVMERAMALRVLDFNYSQNVVKTIARLTPSLGLAGTVISLVKMFGNMQSMDSIAPHMGVAMMSTFYGVIISNLIMLPLCAKLEERAILSEGLMLSTIEGIEAVNKLDHPLSIEERINGFVLSGGLEEAAASSP